MPVIVYVEETAVTASSLADKLRSLVSERRWMSWAESSTPFVGVVTDTRFTIRRSVTGRDSFNPVLYGQFLPTPSGTAIRVVMTFQPAVWLFILFWYAFTGYAVYVQQRDKGAIEAIPLLLALSLIVVAVPMFYLGARKSRTLLAQSLGLRNARGASG